MTFFLRGLFVAVIGEMQSNKLYLSRTVLMESNPKLHLSYHHYVSYIRWLCIIIISIIIIIITIFKIHYKEEL